jgi:hypothetical protein
MLTEVGTRELPSERSSVGSIQDLEGEDACAELQHVVTGSGSESTFRCTMLK